MLILNQDFAFQIEAPIVTFTQEDNCITVGEKTKYFYFYFKKYFNLTIKNFGTNIELWFHIDQYAPNKYLVLDFCKHEKPAVNKIINDLKKYANKIDEIDEIRVTDEI
ncbi:MAG: hypothetical protein PWP15_1088 [Methanothermococcus sp.]|uniref:hypothetical protein n=1 Tax=Methanothermococcus sp. TaxID=2614238 RepID=UPI00258400D9|nr:hypothetical protein [Methanothermococcus sp.]MDK2790581.1 hypothetical protein [Methanothermococcus sp.]